MKRRSRKHIESTVREFVDVFPLIVFRVLKVGNKGWCVFVFPCGVPVSPPCLFRTKREAVNLIRKIRNRIKSNYDFSCALKRLLLSLVE